LWKKHDISVLNGAIIQKTYSTFCHFEQKIIIGILDAIANQNLFSYSLEVIQFVRNLIMFYCLLHPNATYVRRFVFRQVYKVLLTPTLLTND
jgi:hypothetical protein